MRIILEDVSWEKQHKYFLSIKSHIKDSPGFFGGTSISGVYVGFFSSGTVLLRMAGPLRYNLLLGLSKLFGRS